MSFRSGANTDLILRNLQVNGKLTLANELDIQNLDVSGTTETHDLNVDGNAVLNTANIHGNILANSQTVTPAQLGYVSGATSNLQSQINTKAPMANPSFTGTATLQTTQCDGVVYLQNSGASVDNPINYNSQYFGAMGANGTGGHAEVDFVNMGFNASNSTLSAFDWYIMTTSTAETLLMRLYNSGNLFIKGLLTASGISTTTLTASAHSQLADVSANSLTVNGNLDVSGTTVLNTTENKGYMYFNNTGLSNPIDYGSQYFGAIGTNYTGNNAEMDFVNLGFQAPNLTASAFDWYIMTSDTAKKLLMRLLNSGNLLIYGDTTISGNLTVNGQINSQSNMEVLQYNLTGNGGSATVTMPLQYNTTNTTNYIVIPTIYYGYTGSGGTYNAMNSSINLEYAIVISNRTSSSFVWQTSKNGTGDNINVYISFLVLYNVQGTSYPVSY